MNSVPPKIATERGSAANAWGTAIVVGIAGLAVAILVFFFNPSSYGFYPLCQFHRLTGLNCPGCGGTRAVYALLHGNVALALRDNALAVLLGFLAALRACWFGFNRLRGRENGKFFRPAWLIPLLVVLVVFGVLRNLPAFSFLSP